jgi:hypothetical protein
MASVANVVWSSENIAKAKTYLGQRISNEL